MNPDHDVAHIFLTDGEITDGSQDLHLLKYLVPIDCTNIFIGYGIQHDSLLLAGLAKNKNNEYRFIDALEQAGLVYGEIIHGLFYKAIADVVLETNGCEMYDYSTNTWTTSLEIGNLLSEQKRILPELDAEVAAVRALIPRYEAKIQRVLARVWGTA